MTIDFSGFTAAQIEAIEHGHGNLQLIACAGAGKTEVVACRVARLLEKGAQGGLGPDGIIAFTFQEKAAAELKQRIVERCREQLGTVTGMAEMFVGTIHGFCLDLLKDEVPQYLKYEVLGEVRQRVFVDRFSAKSGLTRTTDLKGAALKRYRDTPLYTSALDILRESEIVPGEVPASLIDGLEAYRGLLHERAYLDYAAIMELAAQVLEQDAGVRERIAARVRHVIVDEYQDVNPVQERVVRALHELGAHVCVIGDDDQTIHQWRGSDVGNILSFDTRYPDVHRVRLQENFRSTAGIVETARDFITQNSERLPKAMIPASSQVYERGDVCALNFEDPEAEAAFIAETIEQLKGIAFDDVPGGRGLTYSDMAILLRSVRRNAEPITNALTAAGIKFVVRGLNNLFDTPEVHAARELFYYIAGPGNRRPVRRRPDVVAAWITAGLGISGDKLEAALDAVDGAIAAFKSEDPTLYSLYSLQRVFIRFLEDIELFEERVPSGRGEIVFYNLGKFSQVISDFEAIHFRSKPAEKYPTFADHLQYGVENEYDEGWLDHPFTIPDAVQVLTVHQAKGMQWPVVFVPALVRNRFPAAGVGGRSVWHILRKEAVVGQARYQGSIEDERRLFYVALTRSQKFLFLSWAPIEGFNNRYKHKSEFWEDVLVSRHVKRRRPDFSSRPRLPSRRRRSHADVLLSFSDLKYFFECPYQFKLRMLYGFNLPIHEALGYGKSLHDTLAEVHADAIRGQLPDPTGVPDLLDRHLHVPFAYPALKEQLRTSADRVVRQYLHDNRDLFDKLEFAEKKIELDLGDGVTVVGRIDLVRRIDTDETTIVDLKTSERSQAEDVTELQLHVYVVGHEALTGRTADFVEVYELDEGKRKPRAVDEEFVDDVKREIARAATALRSGTLEPAPKASRCASCDFRRMCSKAA